MQRPNGERTTGRTPAAGSRVPSPVALAALLALALGLWNLPFSSFMADDFIQLSILEHASPVTAFWPFNLYILSDGSPQQIQSGKDLGALPWFFDPKFKMAFFRPLSSASLVLDHAVFGLNPIGYQAHVALWFLLLAVGVAKLYERVLRPAGRHDATANPTLAALIFTIAGVHGWLFWTATRHIVIAAAVGILALLCHLRWREDNWKPGRILSLVGFLISLCAGEAALGVIAYLFAYEAFGAADGRRERIRAALPFVCGLVAYFVMYRLLGLGTSAGSDYVDPFNDPLLYITQIPGRLVFIIGALLLGGNADVWILRPDLRPMMILVAMLITCLGGILLHAVWPSFSTTEQRATRWLFAGTFFAALPFAGSPIGSRCIIVPWIGGALIVTLVLTNWWSVLRHQPGFRARVLSGSCWGLAVVHLVLAPIQRLAGPYLLRQMLFGDVARAVGSPLLGTDGLEGRTPVILNAPDLRVGLHGYFFRQLYRLPMPAAWRVLSWARGPHHFHRSAADSLEMQLEGGGLHAPYLVTGERIEILGMQATVTEIGRNGPTHVTFRFDRPLDDPTFIWLIWNEGHLQAVTLPPIGGTLDVGTAPSALSASQTGWKPTLPGSGREALYAPATV